METSTLEHQPTPANPRQTATVVTSKTANPDDPAPPVAPQAAGPESTSPPVQSEPNGSDDAEPSFSHTRNGKVARLPKATRDRVNQMLLNNVPFEKIIEALGDEGKGITYRNISNWKAGGFQEWLLDQERNESLVLRRDSALSFLEKKAGPIIQDAGRTLATAQLYELLSNFDPTTFAKSLAEKPDLYLRLIGTLVRLSEGEAVCAFQRAKESARNDKPGIVSPSVPPPKVISAEGLREIMRQIKLL